MSTFECNPANFPNFFQFILSEAGGGLALTLFHIGWSMHFRLAQLKSNSMSGGSYLRLQIPPRFLHLILPMFRCPIQVWLMHVNPQATRE